MNLNQPKRNCGNIHSYDPNKVRELLAVTKCLFERLIKDVSQYVRELSKFQDYYQRYDVVYDSNIYYTMTTRLTNTLELFFVAFNMHLSTKTNVKGIGQQIINPPWCNSDNEIVYSTTIKYQNVIKSCNDCNKCRRINKSNCECGTGYASMKDYLKVQSTINVATYDNISISVPSTMTSDGSASDCTITVGNLTYTLTNFPSSTLCSPSDITNLYIHVDKQIKILSSLQNALETNVHYIDKYLCKLVNM